MACVIYNKSYFENVCKIQRKVALLKSNLIKLHVILKHDNAWKCQNTEIFLVCILQYLEKTQLNADQKYLRILTFDEKSSFSWKRLSNITFQIMH